MTLFWIALWNKNINTKQGLCLTEKKKKQEQNYYSVCFIHSGNDIVGGMSDDVGHVILFIFLDGWVVQ